MPASSPAFTDHTTPHNPRDVLIHLQAYLEGQGFFYPRQTVANLYLSLRSKPFVVLAGPSGTGKTQLLRLLAEGLGYRDHSLLIPVRPEWAGRADLLGYLDLNGRFRRQPLLQWMLRAKRAPNEPFFVILDEMNLARVEYYLADLLSVMETRHREQGRIHTQPLLSAAEWGKLPPDDEDLLDLGWPDNLYLAGTVNIDETTFPFSRKVLDRVNVIEMSEVRLDWPTEAPPIEPMQEVYNDFLRAPYVHARDLSPEEKRLLNPTLQWLNRLQRVLQPAGYPLGYRLRDEMAFYLLNRLSIRELIAEGEALDLQLVQKLLPRLQGSSPRLATLLLDLMRLLAPKEVPTGPAVRYESLAAALGDPPGRQLPFPRSLQKLMAMYRRYQEEGFTSFWDV